MKKTYADPAAIRELELYAQNCYALYVRSIRPTIDLMARKQAAGRYDPEKAVTAWYHVATDAAKAYAAEMGACGPWFDLFPVAVRRAVAVALSADFADEVQDKAV